MQGVCVCGPPSLVTFIYLYIHFIFPCVPRQQRRIFDSDSAYLKSLHAPNLHLTNDPIVEILPKGIRTASTTYPADVIIMATGFKTNNGLGPLRVRGRGGEWLDDHWKRRGGPGAYNNTAVHGCMYCAPRFLSCFSGSGTDSW